MRKEKKRSGTGSHGSDAAEEVIFSVELETPLGSIGGRVNVETGPMGLAELVPTALQLTNILVERAKRREEKKGKRVSCRAGCSVCCSQMVPISPPEAIFLTDLIDSLGHDRCGELLRRFESIVRVLEQREMIDRLLDPEYSDDPVMAIAREYFSLEMPCPFLRDGSCTIYEHRPVACREFNVTSPAELCADPYTNNIEKVPMPLPLSAPLARLTGELTGTRPRLIPLTLAPRWVAGHADLRGITWPGIELFRKFMDELGRVPP